MKAYCINCGSIQPSRFRPGQDAITNESYEDLCCDTCHFIVATIQDREASQQPSQARVVELVAAANKDAVLQASIDFIRELTGMEPPPIEVAPPETFQPFKTFADKVCAIFATPQAAAQPPAPGEAAHEYMTGYSDCKEWTQPSQADAQDAARYRWLRSTTNWASNSSNERIDVRNSPELWDAAITAAINAKGR